MNAFFGKIYEFVTSLNFLGPSAKRQYLSKFFENWEKEAGSSYYEQFKALEEKDTQL